MSMTNDLERSIIEELKKQEGGAFQKIFNDYLFCKYHPDNFNTLGSELGTNKTTTGVPDSFFRLPNGKYVLINYGTVKNNPFGKLRDDIVDSLDPKKTDIPKSKIDTIICGTGASNIRPGQEEELHQLVGKDIKLKIITVEDLAKELCFKYPLIAKDHLGINVDTLQILSIPDFVKAYDNPAIAAPLNTKFMFRDLEKAKLVQDIQEHKATIVTGPSGVGKTRLVLQVCKQFEEQGYKVRCIKNNGQSLKDDWQTHTADLSKSLIFIDDANETTDLEFVLNQIAANKDMKLVLTVRDYLKSDVVEKVRSICDKDVPEITIKPLSDAQIEEILKESLGIVNKDYLDKITSAAKGNVRLAMLAGEASKEHGYRVLWNEINIYQACFDPIFTKLKLDESDLKLMFLASFFKTLSFESDFVQDLLNKLEVTDPEKRARSLCRKELVDYFHDKLVRISDQSLGDYLLYKVLFGDSLVKLENLFAWCIPQAQMQLVSSINTILNLFYNSETMTQISEVIKHSWWNLEKKDKLQFVTSFGPVIPDRALAYLSQEIKEIPVGGSNLNGKLVVDSLINFKDNPEYFKATIGLLCQYLDKCPDQLAEASQDLKSILFGDYSFANNYVVEHSLVESLKAKMNAGLLAAKQLFLAVAPAILKFRVSNSRLKDTRTLLIKTGNLPIDRSLLELRDEIWHILGKLYKEPNFDGHEKILEIVKSQYYSQADSKDAETRKWFIQADLKTIQDCIFDNSGTVSGLVALNHLNEQAVKNGLDPISTEHKSVIAKLVTLNQRRLEPKKLVDECGSLEIIKVLAKLVDEPEGQKLRWSYIMILQAIFADNLDSETLDTYFEQGMPFYGRETGLARNLVNEISDKEIRTYLGQSNNLDFVSDLYQELILASRNTEVVGEYQDFLKNNWDQLTISAGGFEAFKQCCSLKPDFLNTIYSQLMANPQQIVSLFDIASDADEVFEMFAGKLDKLRELYLSVERERFRNPRNDDFFDYDLNLFWKLYNADQQFLYDILAVVKEEAKKKQYVIPDSVSDGLRKIFDGLWQSKDCDDIIFDCFIRLHDDALFYQVERLIFESNKSSLKNVKTEWLMKESLKHLDDELIRPLSYMVVEYYPKFTPEYVAKLAEQDSGFDLSRIYVTSPFISGIGSIVPPTQEKIEQLKAIYNKLPIDCFTQRVHLQREIESYEKEVEREQEIDFREGQ